MEDENQIGDTGQDNTLDSVENKSASAEIDAGMDADPIKQEIEKELNSIVEQEINQSEIGEELSVEDLIDKFNQINQSGIVKEEDIPDIPIQSENERNVVEEKSNISKSSTKDRRDDILKRNNEFNTVSGKKLLLESKATKLAVSTDVQVDRQAGTHSRSKTDSELQMNLDYKDGKGESNASLTKTLSKDLSFHSRCQSTTSLKSFRKKSLKTPLLEESIEIDRAAYLPKIISEKVVDESEVEENAGEHPKEAGSALDIKQGGEELTIEQPKKFGITSPNSNLFSNVGTPNDGTDRKGLTTPGKPKVQFTENITQKEDNVSQDVLDKRSAASSAKSRVTPKSANTSESGKSVDSDLLDRLGDEFDNDIFTDYIDTSKSAKSKGQVRKGFVKVQPATQPQETVRDLKLKGIKLSTNQSSRSASPNKEETTVQEEPVIVESIPQKRFSIELTDNSAMLDNISMELKERLKEFELKQHQEEEILKHLNKLKSESDFSYRFTKANKYQKDILQGDVSIPATIPVRPFSTVPFYSEEAERPRISHRAYSDTEIEARPSKFEKKTLDLGHLEDAKFKVLNAIVNKLQTELDILKDRIKKQQDYQNSKNFQLESIKSSKSIKNRDLRELRIEMPLLQEKKRALIQYLQEEFRMQFSKERLRNNHLLATAYEYRQKFIRRNAALERHWEDNVALKDDVLKNLKGVQGLRDEVMVEVNKAQDDVDFLKAAFEKLNTEVNFKRGEKKQMIKKRMVADNSVHIKELELLEVALERRRANGGAAKSIKELDSVDLEDFNLTRLPLAQLDSKKVKFVNVAKNQLVHLNALGAFSELEAIVSDFNQLKQVNFKDMAHLKALSVASNNLTNLEGLSSRLHYLNASANKLTTLKGLEGAPNIRILIISSSKIKDMASIKYLKNLLYLDLSNSQLSEDSVIQLSSCNLLQCLEAGNNHFRMIPDIPNFALNELHLTKNIIQQVNRMSWLFNLRVLNLYDNQISDISPLATIPFLRELYLGHNVIKDIKNVYHIGVCQNLEILDLTGNPVMYDHSFPVTVGMLFPNIRTLNNTQINLNQHKTKRIHTLFNVFAAINFYKEVKTQLAYFIEDPKDDTSEMMKIWKDFAASKDKMIRNYMGPYFSPYLKYLTSKSVGSKFDPMSNLAAQERRLFWLSDAITDILKDTEIMPYPTFDGSIIYYLHQLDFKIKNYKVTYIQALWRMKMQIKKYLPEVLKIQRRLRSYFACIEPRRLLRKLKKEKLEFDAAVMIQKNWKRYILRGKLEEMRVEHKKELEELAITVVRPVPVSEQDHEHSLMEKDMADIDKWLAEEDELKFDKKMKKYLENEALMHYPGMKKRKPPKKDRKRYRSSSRASSSHVVLDKIVVVTAEGEEQDSEEERIVDLEYDLDEKDTSSGSETGSEPPSPPMIDLHHTIQLAKERNDIMINLNRQFNKLVNNLPPTGHLANNDPMVPQTPLKTTNGRIGESRNGDLGFYNDFPPLKTTAGRAGEALHGESRMAESRMAESRLGNSRVGETGLPNDFQSTVGDGKAVASETMLNSNLLTGLKDQFESRANGSTVLDATSFDSASRYTDAIRDKDELQWAQYGRKPPLVKPFGEKQPILPILTGNVQQTPKPPKEHKMIFEWDIHPGNVATKLIPTERGESILQQPAPIQYTGTGAFPAQRNYISTVILTNVKEPQFKPPVTLLINNYVVSKILRPKAPNVDPNTIHRLEPRQRTKKGQYETMLDLIPSQIVPPAYGSYELPKPGPLPSIAKK
ncbi:hypothetical protein HK103_003316 [Boothiomyces macroporosus]|uniref:Uncharacterized protein n=1 Tax=Boothiomyces macroporosus TaxID=261099 RepID=A0AAD5UIW4_9FUNG|nr:hypothetical protein HK103_003316 [Boothiomyces macroporosus]